MTLIVTTFRLHDAALELLQHSGDVVGPYGWQSHLSRADALISLLTVPVDRALLDTAPRLRIVANAVAGYDNIDVPACRARAITVTNTPDVLTDATADLTLALLLATVRRTTGAEASLRAGEFRGWGFWDFLGGDINGALLGIFGMGRIGQAVAKRARGFGMRIQYASRTRLPPERESILGAAWVDWETLLTTSDVLSLHAPGSAETRHLLSEGALRRMKKGSYLINTARGSLVDEGALVEALREGRLAGAGLDVFEREPTVHPGLLELPNVTLLPHIGSATQGTREAMALLACRNVAAVLAGEAPLTPVS